MLSVGTQRTLARVSSASATQTLACAAATISGRASESRRAVARLIGKRRSVGSSGAGFSFRPVARGLAPVAAAPPPGARGEAGGIGKAGGKSRRPARRRGESTAGRGAGREGGRRRRRRHGRLGRAGGGLDPGEQQGRDGHPCPGGSFHRFKPRSVKGSAAR